MKEAKTAKQKTTAKTKKECALQLSAELQKISLSTPSDKPIDIFSEDYSDLPQELTSLFAKPERISHASRVRELFLLRDTMTIRQLTVAYFRKYNIIKEEKYLQSVVSCLIKADYLAKTNNLYEYTLKYK